MQQPAGRAGLVALLVLGWCSVAAAQSPGSSAPARPQVRPEGTAHLVSPPGSASAGVATVTTVPDEPPADARARHVADLMAGTLDTAVDPQSLFDVPLSDPGAVAVEAERLQVLLGALESSLTPAPSASAPQRRSPSSIPSAHAGEAAPAASAGPLLDRRHWLARLELDRARLEFYSLPREQREALLKFHAARRDAARPRETDAERRAREAEAERQRALEAARLARTEAARLVGEELARLLGVQAAVATARERFAAERAELDARRDVVLGWQRRVRDAKAGDARQADTVYDALRRALQAAREELDGALLDLGSTSSGVPRVGDDPLIDVPPDVAADTARERRREVERAIAAAEAEERALREVRARRLLEEINELNRERLGLLPHLTAARRGSITGFSQAGAEQASSELWHLSLVARYDRRVIEEWIRAWRQGGTLGISAFSAAAVGVPWLVLLGLFGAWRRRAAQLLALAETQLVEADHAAHRVTPSVWRQGVGFLSHVRRPLEWLLLFLGTLWLLPASTRSLMEVRLLASMIGWVLAASVLVSVVDALAAKSTTAPSAEDDPNGALRLRSLRLVARVALTFILILVLADRLVGQGTIYGWVLSTCWLASVPVFLVLVHWWKRTIFERVDRVRRKSPVEAWVLAHRSGWKSFVAAMIGGVHLFGTGVVKTLRGWIASFQLVRRAHAYFFRRELDRLASGRRGVTTSPLRESAFAALAPDRACEEWLACPADEPLARVLSRMRARKGGILAVVGARGLGKSTLLRRLAAAEPTAHRVNCRDDAELHGFERQVLDGEPPVRAPAAERPRVVLLDDAQVLVRPVVGGLARLDALLGAARRRSSDTLWVAAFDAVLWPLIQRARDGRTLFDEIIVLEPWSEEQVGALLWQRSAGAGFEPSFEDLLDRLPPSADELDRHDALAARRSGYVRMLWDHVDGNPALALEAWRSSLVEDEAGSVRVRSLQVPDSAALDALPDAALFVLRAILQLAPASPSDVAAATRISEAQVRSLLMLGEAQGYLEEQRGRADVTWRWLRAVVRLLERRHLVVNS